MSIIPHSTSGPHSTSRPDIAQEPGMLRHLRFPVKLSRGRRFPELDHPYRNAFQRDRDRVVHARAFRRLENKTQVFTAGHSDHFRNRLTHTFEVSQVSRTVARVLGLDEDLTEALALAHDIGHPPFGHTGEEQLDQLMKSHGDRFDHNIQALRIVETFENPYPRFPGLNLTFEVREGIVKHSRDFAPGEYPELDEYLPGLRPPLEAQIIDLCDEIAYDIADIDDAYHAGLLQVRDICREVDAFREFEDAVSHQFPGSPERLQLRQIFRDMMDWMVTGLIEETLAAAQKLDDVDAVRVHPTRVARFPSERATAIAQFKRLLRKAVYESEELSTSRHHSAGNIAELFGYLMEHPDAMPAYYREIAASQPLHRQVCDYIAGMTDRFFARTCAQFGIH